MTTPEDEEFVDMLDRIGTPLFTIGLGRDKNDHTYPPGWPKFIARGNTKRLAAREPWDALGAVCGHRMIVLDIDPRNGGDREQVATDLQRMRVTVHTEIRSGGGGTHFYVRPNPGIRSTKNLPVWPGVDILAANRFVYIPGGAGRPEHDHRRYEVVAADTSGLLTELDDGDMMLAAFVADQLRMRDARKPWADREPPGPIPAGAISAIEPWGRRGQRYLETTLQQRCDEIASAAEGGRNPALWRAALTLGSLLAGFTAPDHVVADTITRLTAASQKPRKETDSTISRGIRIGLGNPHVPAPKQDFTRMWKHDRAVAWLAAQLENPALRTVITREAEVVGINMTTLKRAAEALGVISVPQSTWPATVLWVLPQLDQNVADGDRSA